VAFGILIGFVLVLCAGSHPSRLVGCITYPSAWVALRLLILPLNRLINR